LAFLLFFWKRANCAQIVPAERIEVSGLLCGGHFQIVIADDVVAVKNRSRFVAGDHHGDPLRYSCPDHVPHCGSAEIMEEASADAGLGAGGIPGASIISNQTASVPAGKNQRTQLAAAFAVFPLPVDDLLQLSVHEYSPPLLVLCFAWLQSNCRSLAVDPLPCQVGDLRKPPPGLVAEGDEALHEVGQGISQCQKVGVLEEALADIVFTEHRNIRNALQPWGCLSETQIEHSFQRRQVSVGHGLSSTLMQASKLPGVMSCEEGNMIRPAQSL
jgi:hypothetical protein